MNIATAITEVVTFDATPDELAHRDVIIEKVRKQQPVTFGSDVVGDFGIKVHFLDEPKFFELGNTVVKCVIRVKLTIDKDMAQKFEMPTEIIRFFTGYTKCSAEDADKYDFEFAKRITMNKAKVNAYLFFQKMFIKKIQVMHKNLTKTIGFCKKMEGLINCNTKYIMDACNSMYPDFHNDLPDEGLPDTDSDVKVQAE